MSLKQFLLLITSISILSSNDIFLNGQDGKNVVLKENPRKALLFPIPFASMYMALDGGIQNIAGIHGVANKSLHLSFLLNAYKDANNLNTELAQSGFTPNIEQVLSLKPDIIFQWADQGEHVIRPLREIGLPVIGIKYGTQEYLEGWIDMLGKTTGNIEKAETILAWHKEIQELLCKQSLTKKKQKIMAFQFSKDRLRTAGAGSYENYVIELIGSENPAKNDIKRFADISIEQLLVYDPDIIILGSFDTQTPDEFISREVYQGLKAVQNKQVYKFPVGGFIWGIPHIEAPLTWIWLSQIVDYNQDISLVEQMRDKYKMLYSYDISDDEIKYILKSNIHQKSKNYELLLEDIK